ncbi:hypothetical protein ASC66_09455 [Leifsonia sp. Root4]|uniref:glycosyltransferase n=1 Tax=Leifsonia sp. Root4 TaxID=1736525 RepID=UPI0006F1C622|nr:glycosyltransferase [Leifsonia sp. Root4]KQW06670.1 hypothetical protein ASC66_09455 [Leifsonia sp. Root4]
MAERIRSRRVIVWRNSVLPGSETFIRNQIDSMRQWTPQLVGAKRVQSPLLRAEDTVIYGAGRAERAWRKMFRLTRRSARLNRAIREVDASLIHAHFGPDAVTITPTARRLRLPLIVTVHGYDVTTSGLLTGFNGWRYRRRLAQAFRYASTIIAVSEFIRDAVIHNLGADPAKVVVHHIGIPVSAPDARPRAEPEWDVVFVGRLVEKKGVGVLLDAVALAQAELPKTPRIAIIGNGALRSFLEQRASLLQIDATFFGSQPPEKVLETLRNSRVFAGPSRTAPSGDAEGFGMVFLEAAAAGLPVVSSQHGGVPEAVLDGVTGLLSAEGDARGLANNLVRLLSNPSLASELGRRGEARVRTDFDVLKQTASLEEIYDLATIAR